MQEDALKRYAESHGGTIVKLFKIAETASKSDERRSFRELVAYTKKNAPGLDGFLFRSTRWTEPQGISLIMWNWNGWNQNTVLLLFRFHNRLKTIPLAE